MSGFQPVDPTEAHPTRDEYVVERALNDGRWVVESITPETSAEQAEKDGDRPPSLPWLRGAELRVVRRTITSTVVSVRPSAGPVRPGEQPT